MACAWRRHGVGMGMAWAAYLSSHAVDPSVRWSIGSAEPLAEWHAFCLLVELAELAAAL